MGRVAKFAEEYKHLAVDLTPATAEKTNRSRVFVRVRNYKNYNYLKSDGPEMTAKEDLWPLWNGDASPGKPHSPAGFTKDRSFMAAFSGVASPGEIAFVLSVVAHYAATKKHPFSVGPEIGWQLQGYVDDYIGIDCLGFLSNCANHVLHTGRYRDNATVSYGHIMKCGTMLHKLSELDGSPLLALVYTANKIWYLDPAKPTKAQPGRHAVLADGSPWRTGADKRTVNIVESNGETTPNGLQSNQFEIIGDAIGDLFHVRRLSPSPSEEYVYILRLT